MKLNRNGLNNLIVIIACVVVVVLILSDVHPLMIFGVIGAYAIYQGIATIYYKEIPGKQDYKDVKDKTKYCIHTAVWMLLLGLVMIGLCIALMAGMSDVYFWGGTVLAIICAAFYNNVVKRFFVIGYESNLDRMWNLLSKKKK